MDTSLKTLRDYSKARLDILKLLRDAEIHQEVELPHIVAVGIQSVGKSSVNEAISTLKLPRGVGTCTKCPMEFRLEHSTDSPSLSVDITLRFASDEHNVPFRSNLSDLNEIRQAIADAQERILDPSLLGRATAPTPGVSARTFSEDCVCVFAKGPNMPDLCFYDIPGVIEDVGDGQDPAQIDLIKNLVKKYASKRNCIVLLVVSCEYDLEIGGVPRLIFTESDPELKERTVGVLTKVDRIVEDMRPAWLETFHNKTRKLDNGWFAVKLPAGGDIPWEEARTQEREFFRDNEPWKSINREDRNRLGSEQLTQYISKLLSNLVAARLPGISQDITKIIDQCDTNLEHLPFHTERDAYDTVLTVIDKFSTDFSAHIQGIPPKPFTTEVGLVYQVKELYDTIRHGVSEHTPRFCPFDTPGNGSPARSSPAWSHLCAKGEIVYLDKMMEYIKRAVTRELPGELPYGITPRIITHVVQSWQDVAITGFRNVKAVAIDHFNGLVQDHFAEYERGGLLSSVQEILDENIAHCAAVTVAELKGLAAMELVPSTVLKEEYIVLQAAIYQHYQGELAPDPGHETSLLDVFEAFLVKNSASIVAEITAGVISTATRNSLIDQFATSGHDQANLNSPTVNKDRHNALTVMSSAQAYLELASKRFEDVAANCIDHGFLRQLDIRVRKALRALPANTSPEMCLQLIQDPTLVDRRRREMEKRNHYAGIKHILDNARRDLERDDPEMHVHTGLHQRAPDPNTQNDSDGEASYTPLSVNYSTPSLTEINVADEQ
ncbi:P-loop containing nucleoside triphosphate hydrolase protein [Mycena metata]|uniref:P-loop containing nucleoside triphosphate hydrolase protein n=1 Tax=Mycena metata TaxID=1033252 RepID=A0AAD7JPX5_9AGAR|nr:P-loop containing nucleoside triphosphate hydrolase protein [Mycena metata]